MRALLPMMIAVACVLGPSEAVADIAVFTEGRVLRVEDAAMVGTMIRLTLPGGGVLEVPALRIDRVVDDEIDRTTVRTDLAETCDPSWTDVRLPDRVPYADLIEDAARSADLDPRLLAALVRTESDFNPVAVSRVGARGLCQLMPAAAADHAVGDVFDPVENLRGGASHLRMLLDRFGQLPLALAAYNAGATTVNRYGGVPPYRETRDYVRRILAEYCPDETDEEHR